MSSSKNIVIVGAGLVGSLLAVMLGRRGHRVTVFEKRPDMRTVEISAGRSINLALARRGIDPLKQAGLFADVKNLLIPMRGRMLHDIDGQLEFSPYGQREDEVIYSVSRGELNKLMMTSAQHSCQVDLQFEQACEAIDLEQRTCLVQNTKDKTSRTVEFDVVIGADGAGSVVRDSVLAKTGGQEDVDFLEHQYKELCIPAGKGGQFQMEKEALHIWPRGGYMLIALPNLDGSYTVTLFLSANGDPGFQHLQNPAQVESFFAEQFPDALALMPELGTDFFENPTGLLGTVRCRPWNYEDCGLILGDASHAIVPFHGQGMNAGFEDCLEFCRRLDQSDEDWSTVIREFGDVRKSDTDAIADMALENYVIMRDSVRDEKFQLKKELGFALERQLPDHFIPRYSMVMFHRIPYHIALQRGKTQDELLNQLVGNASGLGDIDMDRAKQVILQKLPPLPPTE